MLLAAAAFIAELASLVLVGSYVGWLWTFGLLAIAVVLGVGVLSGRGPATLRQVVLSLRDGTSPGAAIVDGALLAIAGILFITPGFASDTVAIGLLLPPVRAAVRARLRAWATRRFGGGRAGAFGHRVGILDEELVDLDRDRGIDVIDATGHETRDPRPGRGPSLPS